MSEGSRPPDSQYRNPLETRYAGEAMRSLFSPCRRALVWRDLWIALAEAQKELGLQIREEQIAELREKRGELDLDRVAGIEAELRHEVMAHLRHYGEVAPSAKGILHLGATSCFVTDNADLVLFREALGLIEGRLVHVLSLLRDQALMHRDLPCLGYTHFQAAQPTTFGKRVAVWMQDFLTDLSETSRLREELPLRGAKGTTGTQASYLSLFEGDHEKVRELDRRVARKLGFAEVIPVTGQTYSRKLDHMLLTLLASVAQSASKFGTDFRLLSHENEVSEPFEEKQIGSSAMAYKKNPMRTERLCSLSRFVLALSTTGAQTAANQWLERSLDDSAIRRISLPEAFLAVDACLLLVANVAKGMQVHPKVMARHLEEHLPFLATEEILMEGVKQGGDRQDLHERIRVHALEGRRRMKEEGMENPLLSLLEEDPAFAFMRGRWREVLDPRRFTGRASEQVEDFLREALDPLLQGRSEDFEDEIRV